MDWLSVFNSLIDCQSSSHWWIVGLSQWWIVSLQLIAGLSVFSSLIDCWSLSHWWSVGLFLSDGLSAFSSLMDWLSAFSSLMHCWSGQRKSYPSPLRPPSEGSSISHRHRDSGQPTLPLCQQGGAGLEWASCHPRQQGHALGGAAWERGVIFTVSPSHPLMTVRGRTRNSLRMWIVEG